MSFAEDDGRNSKFFNLVIFNNHKLLEDDRFLGNNKEKNFHYSINKSYRYQELLFFLLIIANCHHMREYACYLLALWVNNLEFFLVQKGAFVKVNEGQAILTLIKEICISFSLIIFDLDCIHKVPPMFEDKILLRLLDGEDLTKQGQL